MSSSEHPLLPEAAASAGAPCGKWGTGTPFAPQMYRLAQAGLPIRNIRTSTGEPLKGVFFQSHNSSAKKIDSFAPNPISSAAEKWRQQLEIEKQ